VWLVYHDGKLQHTKAIGNDFNAKSQAPVGALSQWLTAALVMTFVDQGKLSLGDKVSQYLPVYGKYSKGYITIRDCLAHLTGIAAKKEDGFGHKRKYENLDAEATEYASKREIQVNPATEFRFNAIGPDLVARIVEVVGKRGFEQLMQERITRPLMMRNTSFYSFNAPGPAEGALSSPNDLMNFLSMLLNKGIFNGKRILSEKSIAELRMVRTTQPMMKEFPEAMSGYSYGLGAWIPQADADGNGTLLFGSGLNGTWMSLDFCHGYASIFFTKGTLKDENKDIFNKLTDFLSGMYPSDCH
jgi:CubicO group peptidase (beta-lactamase class C family)